MKQILFIIGIVYSNCLMAQTPYEVVDSLSNEISLLQSTANEHIYPDGDQTYTISFPEDNFGVLTSNRLAYRAIYKKSADKEILALTEDIDLTKMISFSGHYNGNGMGVFRMKFPPGSLKTTIIEDGAYKTTIRESHLDFFSTVKNEGTGFSDSPVWKLYSALAYLCQSLKTEKEVKNSYDLNELAESWNKALNQFDEAAFEAFLAQYPNTVYTAQAQRKSSELAANAKSIKWLLAYADSIASEYKFKRGLSVYEYQSSGGIAKNDFISYNNVSLGDPTISYIKKNNPRKTKTSWPEGLCYYMTDQQNEILCLIFNRPKLSTYEDARQRITDLKAHLERNIQPQYITIKGQDYQEELKLILAVPVSFEDQLSVKYYIVFTSRKDDDGQGVISVSFATEKRIAEFPLHMPY